MKKEKEVLPVTKGKKTGPGSDPVNKFKKGQHTTAASIDNIISSAVENVKSRPGSGASDEGTMTSYDEER